MKEFYHFKDKSKGIEVIIHKSLKTIIINGILYHNINQCLYKLRKSKINQNLYLEIEHLVFQNL